MATPQEKLAESLEVLKELQDSGVVAIRSADLSRVQRERLSKAGFLKEVMKGWYIPARPDESEGESTSWYTSYWGFCADYLNSRFANEWVLSPEQSASLHAGNWTVPNQLLIRAARGGNKPTNLPHETSLFDVRASLPSEDDAVIVEGLRLYALPTALIECSPGYFQNQPTDARAALAMIKDASDVLSPLLDGGHSVIAGRLAAAFRNIGRTRIADDIISTMKAAGYAVREDDPFERKIALPGTLRMTSPYVGRVNMMWQSMRDAIPEHFPKAPGLPENKTAYLRDVDDAYVTDAYHSLSIEGYQVSPELIERVRSGDWNPENNEADKNHRDALAARGYWLAAQAVRKSVEKVLDGENPGGVADGDHGTWYREMFTPSVTAGLVRARDLAGYRSGPVYIRRSKHVPPNREAVRELMPAFFDLLTNEDDSAVRVVLGHFVFVYIHPYIDGNGRTGRFLMNLLMAAAGYPWTVVPLQRRDDYMAALESASVEQDIVPFTKFLAELVSAGLKGEKLARIPSS